MPRWLLTYLKKRRIKRFLEELPNAIDVIVRGIQAGLPLGDCMRMIAGEAQEPLRGEFRAIIEAQTLGHVDRRRGGEAVTSGCRSPRRTSSAS